MMYFGKSQSFKATNPMASDASAFFWYAPESIDATGSAINSWDDLSGNGFDLTQEGAVAKPTYDSGSNSVLFTGSEVLSNGAFVSADSWEQAVSDVAGQYIAYLVIKPTFTDTAATYEHALLVSGEASADTDANQSNIRLIEQSNDTDARAEWRARRFSGNMYDTTSTGLSVNATTLHDEVSNTLCLLKYKKVFNVSQFSVNDGSVVDSGDVADAVDAASIPNANDRLYVGAFCTAADALSQGYKGELHEIFVTSNESNETEVTNFLISKYGL